MIIFILITVVSIKIVLIIAFTINIFLKNPKSLNFDINFCLLHKNIEVFLQFKYILFIYYLLRFYNKNDNINILINFNNKISIITQI